MNPKPQNFAKRMKKHSLDHSRGEITRFVSEPPRWHPCKAKKSGGGFEGRVRASPAREAPVHSKKEILVKIPTRLHCIPPQGFYVSAEPGGMSLYKSPTHGRLQAATRDPLLRSERTQGFTAGPVYGRARCSPMLGSLKT